MTWNFPEWFGVALAVGALLFVGVHLVVLIFCLRGRRKVAGVAGVLIGVGWAIAGWWHWAAVVPAALFAALGVWALAVVRPRTLIAASVGGAVLLAVVPGQLRAREDRISDANAEAWQVEDAARCERLAARFELRTCSELPSARQVGPYDDAPGTTFWMEHRCASTYYNAIYQLQDETDGHDAGDGPYWAERAAVFADQLADCIEDRTSLREMATVLRQQQRVGELALADKVVGFRVEVSPYLDGGTKVAIITGANQ